MGAYSCGVTPELQERNPFPSIAVLVVVMAAVAGLAMRFGLNSVVAIICVAIAIVGTWVLLSPQIETLEPAHVGSNRGAPSGPTTSALSRTGAGGVATQGRPPTGNVQAFSATPETAAREKLRTTPRLAVGFDTAETERRGATEPARLASLDDDAFADSVAPVQALGQLPQDASALHIATTVEPESNISGSYTLGQFEVRTASRRGSDHVILNDARQDDYIVASAANGRYLVVVVADGQGSAENAHYGSYWSCRLLAQAIDQHLRDGVPGIEKMLERTRDELSQLFDLRFTDGTKMRTIATTLVGLIAPVDGGPAAGFRVGDGDIFFADGEGGWSSVFDTTPANVDAVFPRTIEADVAPLELDVSCLLLATDGVSGPITTNAGVAASYAEGLVDPVSEVEFDQLMSFPLEEARGDRTAVGVWFTQK